VAIWIIRCKSFSGFLPFFNPAPPSLNTLKKYIDKIFTSENAQTSIRGRISNAINKKDSLFTAEYIPVSGKNKNKLTNVLFIGKKQRLVSFLINTC
jgi:adenine-specific DNA-methyltransferase